MLDFGSKAFGHKSYGKFKYCLEEEILAYHTDLNMKFQLLQRK